MEEKNFNQEEDIQIIPEVETIIENLQRENADLKDKYLRASAELDNFRKRTIKEKTELIKTAAEKTLLSILPVVDDLERADEELEKDMTEEQWFACLEGYKVISNKFIGILRGLGLEKVDPRGEMFDPEIHEAVAMRPVESPSNKGRIMDCIQPGYKLGDKIIRFAKVIVGQ